MKTGIITFHFVNNYGGALQAYALRKYVSENFCEDTELIDYRHWFIQITDAIRMLPLTANFKYYKPWLHCFPSMRQRRKKFAEFMKREGHLSKKTSLPSALKKIGANYRMLICGSDQIWNPLLTFGLSKPYFLRFAGANSRRISYAASASGTIRRRDKMLVYLRDLDAVSIRENVDWLESEDQLHIEHHIDPTLLLSEHQWQDVAVMPDGQDKYILSYFMQKNENAYSIIGEIKEKTKFKTYDISRYGFKPDCIDKALVNVGPEEFVGLFRNAQHVCTNSFHGLVFALIFNKSVDYIPIHRFSGRIEYLCKLLHLRKVPVQNGAYYHIEYDPAEKDRILEAERRRTYSYLEKEIGKAHDTNCR